MDNRLFLLFILRLYFKCIWMKVYLQLVVLLTLALALWRILPIGFNAVTGISRSDIPYVAQKLPKYIKFFARNT